MSSKFGVDKFGRENAHFADLCELEMLNGLSVYEGYINEYIAQSNHYITANPQEISALDLSKLQYLRPANSIEINDEEAKDFCKIMELVQPDNVHEVHYQP